MKRDKEHRRLSTETGVDVRESAVSSLDGPTVPSIPVIIAFATRDIVISHDAHGKGMTYLHAKRESYW